MIYTGGIRREAGVAEIVGYVYIRYYDEEEYERLKRAAGALGVNPWAKLVLDRAAARAEAVPIGEVAAALRAALTDEAVVARILAALGDVQG